MKFLAALLFAKICLTSQLIVDIIYSSFADIHFVSNLTALAKNSFKDEFEFNLIYIDSLWDEIKTIESPDIIFDLTFSITLSESIKKFAEEEKIIITSIYTHILAHRDWEFFIHNSWESQIEALYGIISYFNWQTFIVISDQISNENSEIFANYFNQKNYRWYFFANSNNENSANLFIGRVIQPIGIRNIVILNQGESTKLLLKALEEKNLLTNGTGIIVGSEGAWGLIGNGIIGFAESGLESADSFYSYEGLAFIKFLKIILNLDYSSDLSLFERLNSYYIRETEKVRKIKHPTFANSFLNESCYENFSSSTDCVISNFFTVNNYPISNFTLLNTKNSQKLISGNIFKGNLTVFTPLSFPGDSWIVPNSPFSYINIWYDNALGLSSGILYTLIYWKSAHYLEGFEITSTELMCAGDTYARNFCFSRALSTPAVGFITSLFSSDSISYIYTLRSLNCSIPSVSPYSPSSTLQNKTAFPEFMTIMKDIKFNAKVMLDLAVVFRWQNFIVLYDDINDLDCQYFISLIDQFNMKTANKFKIKIANTPDMRKMNTTYTLDKYSQWKDWFKSLISLNVRLYVIFLNVPSWYHVIESFYDTGLRRGDAIFLSNGRVAYSLTWETDVSQISKLIELLYGSVVVFHAEWFGEFGKKMENGYLKEYGGSSVFSCYSFDATMLLLHGIEFTIRQGQNVEDSHALNINLRKQKFLGCSGTVSIESEGNQRSLPTIGIHNVRWDNNTQLLYEELVGIYDTSSAQLINLYQSIIWYDNSTITPTDSIVYENNCPFPKSKIFYSKKGANILYGISGALIALSIIESFAIWKIFWFKINIEKLIVPARVHFEDYYLMGILALDFLQFISQGPDISELNVWLSKICKYSLINFNSSTLGDIYWVYLYGAMVISCYWVFTAFILFFEFERIDIWIVRYTRNIALFLMPIIGYILFVPVISILLSIFECDKGIGSNISDSFIKYDCTIYCWNNNNNYYLWAAFSIISMIVFIPLVLFFRNHYENINSHINIKTKPSFIIEKAVFQVIIVVMNKTIKNYDEALHGLCCVILLTILIFLCFKNNPYNYGRMNCWLIISYFAILWNFILSSLYWLTKFDNWIVWFIIEWLIWIILIVIGIIFQWKSLPSLLMTDKGVDIAFFLKFGFGSQISAKEINKMKRETVNDNYLSISKTPNFDEQSNVSSYRLNMQSDFDN